MQDRGLRTLAFIWTANLISMFGTGLTGFAIGVWVYQRTGSVTGFAFIILAMLVPGLIFTPVAGFFVDRWNRRWVIILSDCGAALSALSIALLLLTGRFEVWYFFISLSLGGVFGVFRQLSLATIIPMLIPKQHFGRVSGLMQIGFPLTRILCPLVAGLMLSVLPIHTVILIDVCTFFVPISTMLLIRLPKLQASVEGNKSRASFWQGFISGFTFIKARRGALVLLILFNIYNITNGLAHALYQPLLLSFTSVKAVGLMTTIGACGFLAGSLFMGVWGGPKRRIRGIFVYGLLYGFGLMVVGIWESVPLIAVAFFGIIFGMPIIFGSVQAMWLSKTPPDLQGRVFAVWTMTHKASIPVAYLVAGPLADGVFKPLMAVDGSLAGSVGAVIGVGPGRGIALFYIAIGIVIVLTTTVCYLHPRFRLMEDEMPDVIKDDAPVNLERSYT
jgi:MFS family permease